MSAFGTKRTCQPPHLMSAFGGRADMRIVRPLLPFPYDPESKLVREAHASDRLEGWHQAANAGGRTRIHSWRASPYPSLYFNARRLQRRGFATGLLPIQSFSGLRRHAIPPGVTRESPARRASARTRTNSAAASEIAASAILRVLRSSPFGRGNECSADLPLHPPQAPS
jgi:hypothetical protein